MANFKLGLFFMIILLCCTHCSDDSEKLNNDRVYDFVVKDLFTGNTMSGVEVNLLESYGGSFILDSQFETSDEFGALQFTTFFNQDSVDLLIIENMNDPETTVWQPVNVVSEYYGFSSLAQNGEMLGHRNILEQRNLVTLFSYDAAKLQITFLHEEIEKRHNISIKLTTEENEDFFSSAAYQLLENSEMETGTIQFPANKNVKLFYEIREVDMVDWTDSIIRQDSTFIFGSFEEDISFTISI